MLPHSTPAADSSSRRLGERSMEGRPPVRNGLDFDPVAEFSRFGIYGVDAERPIGVAHLAVHPSSRSA